MRLKKITGYSRGGYPLPFTIGDFRASPSPPEVEMLMGLLRQVELCQAQCKEMLKGPINLKKLEALFQESDDFTINIPELKLLKQYRSDAISIVDFLFEREDQENVVNELSSIQRDGELLKIQVNESFEVELKKTCCRVKALKALRSKMSLDFIQVMTEATMLQIGKERLFGNISGVLSAAMFWEERATHVLASEAQMFDFEDAVRYSARSSLAAVLSGLYLFVTSEFRYCRTSEDICAILPSVGVVVDALSVAKSWLKMSEPFLVMQFVVQILTYMKLYNLCKPTFDRPFAIINIAYLCI